MAERGTGVADGAADPLADVRALARVEPDDGFNWLRSEHVPVEDRGDVYCSLCLTEDDWPCTFYLLLERLALREAALDAERAARRNVLALADEADRLAEDGHGWVTTSALRAVLGG